MSRAGISVNASGARYHEQRSKWCKGAQDWICQQTLSSPLGTKAPTLLKTTYFLPWCKLLRWLNKCLQPDNLTIWDIGGISYSKYREVLYKGILKALRKPYLFILGSNAWTTPLRFSPFRSTLPSKDRAQLLLRQNGFTLPSLLQSFGCRSTAGPRYSKCCQWRPLLIQASCSFQRTQTQSMRHLPLSPGASRFIALNSCYWNPE